MSTALDTDTSIETNLDVDWDSVPQCDGFNSNGCENQAQYRAKHICCKASWLACEGCKTKCDKACKSPMAFCGRCHCPMPTITFTEL